ncbi:hypothetical protein ACOMHN_055106 [Nucella lapillus]
MIRSEIGNDSVSDVIGDDSVEVSWQLKPSPGPGSRQTQDPTPHKIHSTGTGPGRQRVTAAALPAGQTRTSHHQRGESSGTKHASFVQ